MKITINASVMKERFENWNRDYYSFSGCEALLDFYDEIDENMELDVIAICCDCTEYGGHGAACGFDSLIADYGYMVDDLEELETEEEKVSAIVTELEDCTTVLFVENGNYIVFAF